MENGNREMVGLTVAFMLGFQALVWLGVGLYIGYAFL